MCQVMCYELGFIVSVQRLFKKYKAPKIIEWLENGNKCYVLITKLSQNVKLYNTSNYWSSNNLYGFHNHFNNLQTIYTPNLHPVLKYFKTDFWHFI